ncbi:MAG: MmgE/PrpD family protein [Hyphomicrobiales bacterium]
MTRAPCGRDPVAFIHEVTLADLPGEIVAQTRRCLVDLVGVAAAGATTDNARIVRDFAASQLAAPAGGARILFDGRRASRAGAAYAGAALIDSCDAHDGHMLTKGHAGAALLPALLAVVDAGRPVDPGEFLAALAMGYEVATRAGIALHATVADYHSSGAWNALGAAAIASRLLKLDRSRTREALGIAEYHGPRSQMMRVIDHPSMLKDGSGYGAFAGVAAADLAALGFTGAPAITVEGAECAHLWADLGKTWRIREQYFKPYPVCRWAHPPIEALRALRAEHPFAAADVVSVRVETFTEAARLDERRPAGTDAAQYSLPFALAAFLLRGRLAADEIAGAALTDTAILSLADRIEAVTDPELAARYPAERIARVTLRLHDGRELRSGVAHARGAPEDPLSDEELDAKFEASLAWLGPERAGAVRQAAHGFPDDRGGVEALLEAVLMPTKG